MTNQDLIRALGTVPEKKLRLLELARELAGPDGKINLQSCVPRMAEIEQAAAEVEAYIRETSWVIGALDRLLGR